MGRISFLHQFCATTCIFLICAGPAAAADRIPSDPAHADSYRAALGDYEAGRYEPAHALFTELAKQRVVEAQFMLGVMSEFGDGVPPSYHDAVGWYLTAAEGGLASAQNRLGTLYANGIGVAPDRERAEFWLRKAAAQADASALHQLGDIKSASRGDSSSRYDAYAYYWLAAEAGFPGADEKTRELAAVLNAPEFVRARNRAAQLKAELEAGHAALEMAPPAAAGSVKGAIVLRRAEIPDPKTRSVAGTFLVPDGWVVEGGVAWDRHLVHLAAPWVVLSNAERSAAVEFFPPRSFKWEDGGIEFSPIGTLRRGYEVRPPIDDAALFVESVVVVRERGKRSGLRVVERESLPEPAAAMADTARRLGVRTAADAARVRIAYAEGGVEVEEDFYCVLGRIEGNSFGESALWGPRVLFSLRAPAGELDRKTGLLLSIATSHRIDRKWYDKYRQVLEMWNQGRGNATPREDTLDMYAGAVSYKETPASMRSYRAAVDLETSMLFALAETSPATRLEDDPAGPGRVPVPASTGSLAYVSDGTYRLAYVADAAPPAVAKKRRGADFDVFRSPGR